MDTTAVPDPTVDLEEFLHAFFPVDGPHSPERTRTAVVLIANLVRYLNHATYSPNSAPTPPVIDGVLNALNSAAWGLPQLLRQIAALLARQADDPRLAADSLGAPIDPRAAAAGAAEQLAAAGELLERLLPPFDRQRMQPVRAVASRLYFEEPTP